MEYLEVFILVSLGLIYWGLFDIYKLLKQQQDGEWVIMSSDNNEVMSGAEPVGGVRTFKPNLKAITDFEALQEFLDEMGLGVVTIGPQTLEDVGRNPKWWVEVVDTNGETVQ